MAILHNLFERIKVRIHSQRWPMVKKKLRNTLEVIFKGPKSEMATAELYLENEKKLIISYATF